jgi:small-conductance mechanosensitive channel
VYAYVKAPDYAAFLAVQEELLMRIMRIAKDAGTGLAIPSQATYVRPDQQEDRPTRAPKVDRAVDAGTAGATQPSGSTAGEA